MAYDEFQIPNGYNQSELRAEISAIQDTLTMRSPEKERAPFQRIKDIENQVFAYREAQLEASQKISARRNPKGWLSGLVFAPQNRTISELIDEESRLGGTLFGQGSKFWLDAKVNGTVFSNDVADWYFLQDNPVDPKRPTVLRFQTTPYSIHKLYDGVEYAPTMQELETFVKATELYPKAILPLYPLDQALDELNREHTGQSKDSYAPVA